MEDMGKVICGDCIEVMAGMPDGCIDLTVTSPPYDGLRSYGGITFGMEEFAKVAEQLYRVTADGGVVVWVVADQTKKGSESGTSFRQALGFMDIGFRLHDTMIYQKVNPVPNAGRRYQQEFEYMFVLSKGSPKTVNILTEPRRNSCQDRRKTRIKPFSRNKDGSFSEGKLYEYKEFVPRRNIWSYKVGQHNSTMYDPAFGHPAIFPEALVYDHVMSWSEEGDVVLDPFCGSGTTLIVAKLTGRGYVGIDSVEEYCELARKRLLEQSELRLDK